jgi:prepilin-type N-terminal cleavage/methylation domain-containing protein
MDAARRVLGLMKERTAQALSKQRTPQAASLQEAGMKLTRRGFTLIEVLVVLVIAAIVMSVLISVMGSSFEILRAGENKAKLNANARLLIDYIANDLQSASYIPLASDRDLNGYADEADTGKGYRDLAVWRVADIIDDVPAVHSSYFLSEAWSDRLMTRHFNNAFLGFETGFAGDEGTAIPKVIRNAGTDRSAQWISFIRLAIPANDQMPYYLSQESDRDGDGSIDQMNTGAIPGPSKGAGEIQGYPEQAAVGPHKETAVAIQDFWYALEGDEEYKRIRQIPVASNITRIRFEYFHEVPVYQSRVSGATLQLFAQDVTDGSVGWINAGTARTSDMVPLVDHWEERIVDVAYNSSNTNTGFYSDPDTGTIYGIMSYRLQDQYPEGYDDLKRTGTHVSPPTGFGLGTNGSGGIDNGWNCTTFYNIDQDGDGSADNAPVDRLGFVTTGLSSTGAAVEGGIAQLRPDMEALQGASYWAYSLDPTGRGDLGDADGIPDGDGQPDDPVPGWWLPYVKAVRITVVATPSKAIEQRMTRSGQVGSTGQKVYYRLDKATPFADAARLVELPNQKKDYVAPGADLILTKTVPVRFAYSSKLITDPRSTSLVQGSGNFQFNRRRVDLNYIQGSQKLWVDPLGYDTQIVPNGPTEKLWQMDPDARKNFFNQF